MPAGDIVLNMIGRNSVSPAANAASGSLRQLNGAIDAHISHLVGETRAQANFRAMIDSTIDEMRAMTSAQSQMGRGANAAVSGTQTLAAGVTKTQFALQQGVYAADDFVAAFTTGGFQGGIRGAANNLTLMAGTLGTVRTQLIAVAGLAAVQLFPKIAERVGFANTNVTDFRDRLSGISSHVGNLRSSLAINEQVRTIPKRVGDLSTVEQADARVLELEEQITKQRNVDLKALEVHRNTLQDILDMQQRGQDASNLADEFGFLINGQADIASIQNEIHKVTGQIRVETEQIAALDKERMATMEAMPSIMRRQGDARRAEIAETTREEAKKNAVEEKGINAEAARRFERFRRSVGLPSREQDRNRDLANQFGFRSISDRGPQNLQAGSAEAFRFINQARLGSASKSSEARELEKLNRNSAEILATLREQVRLEREAETVEIIDF